ncbi:uncharacterized protein LOC111367003 [Olea europaea var. sylvestris]|uniref:uncharacterized protein LOC111367003 n=1 Tax=Olea europaea var. sylvestris TaxID=158386 RepID=UPI000C1D1D7F|nr:uncharacterized protein LOC111367003 [Olea europaea var. sylvestris]
MVMVRKLRPYSQSHAVQVMTNKPIKQILHQLKTSARLLKWAIELSEFDIKFRPRTAIKVQALGDFIPELTIPLEHLPGEQADWKIFVDGSSNDEGSMVGIIIIGPNGEELEYSLRFEFPTTNNDAEYEAVIMGLATRLRVTSVEICNDSQLIVGQVTEKLEAKDGKMAAYLMEVKNLQKGFAKSKITKHAVDVVNVEHGESWMDPLIEYLTKDKLPEDAFAARRLRARAASFAIIDGLLYKRGFTMPYLKCLRPTEAWDVLVKIHAGTCGNHQRVIALAFKALRQGYYWPSMKEDAKELVRKCDACQRHGNLIHIPIKKQTTVFGWAEAEPLATITTTKVQGFVWKNIMCRFGIPRVVITYNGKQFDNHKFRAFCTSYHIDHRLISVAHPQLNGQAEVTNRTILWDLKTRLEKEKGLWTDELPNLDVAVTRAELDLLEGARERAAIRMLAYKRRVAEYFNRRAPEVADDEGAKERLA